MSDNENESINVTNEILIQLVNQQQETATALARLGETVVHLQEHQKNIYKRMDGYYEKEEDILKELKVDVQRLNSFQNNFKTAGKLVRWIALPFLLILTAYISDTKEAVEYFKLMLPFVNK